MHCPILNCSPRGCNMNTSNTDHRAGGEERGRDEGWSRECMHGGHLHKIFSHNISKHHFKFSTSRQWLTAHAYLINMIDCVLPRSLRCLAASAAPWEGRPRHAALLEPQTHPVRSMLPLCFRHLRTLSESVCHVAPSQKSYEVSDNASLCSTTRRSHKAKCSLEGHTQCHTSCASQQSGAGPQPDTLMSTTQITHSMMLHAPLTPSTELCTSWRKDNPSSSCPDFLLLWANSSQIKGTTSNWYFAGTMQKNQESVFLWHDRRGESTFQNFALKSSLICS